MADETKRIQVTLGPYRGQQLDVPAEDADQAIADGWATDPFAPPPQEGEEPIAMTDDDRMAAIEAAEKAARKLRGEDDSNGGKAKHKTREMEPQHPGKPYTTREAPPPQPVKKK